MNANEIAFGIEFETTLPNRDDTPIGPYHAGYQVPWLPEGWRAERDGSIRPTTANRKGCEFVSPKLRGWTGLLEIETAIDRIAARCATRRWQWIRQPRSPRSGVPYLPRLYAIPTVATFMLPGSSRAIPGKVLPSLSCMRTTASPCRS